jgi:hypothetical protein
MQMRSKKAVLVANKDANAEIATIVRFLLSIISKNELVNLSILYENF